MVKDHIIHFYQNQNIQDTLKMGDLLKEILYMIIETNIMAE